jgi:hypothetical protein
MYVLECVDFLHDFMSLSINQSISLLTSINVTTVTIEQVTYSTYHIQSCSNRLCQSQ